MGIFKTSKMLYGNPGLTRTIADEIASAFRSDGYDVDYVVSSNGWREISITKGGLFKRCLGMRTAMKVILYPYNGNIKFETEPGIFGNQVIPVILVASGLWIVLIPQIWGLIRQSKLDDKALEIAERIVYASKR
jgi:hypothetical protein